MRVIGRRRRAGYGRFLSISTGMNTTRSAAAVFAGSPAARGIVAPASHPFAQHAPSLLFLNLNVRTICRATNATHAATINRTRRCCSHSGIA